MNLEAVVHARTYLRTPILDHILAFLDLHQLHSWHGSVEAQGWDLLLVTLYAMAQGIGLGSQ